MTNPHASNNPEVLAIIPARGGSKGVPGKNLQQVGGIPLLVRAIRACQDADLVSEVAVSTDDDQIAAIASAAGATVIRRPDALAADTSSSEAALRHTLELRYLDQAPAEVMLLVQCTSPFITAAEINAVVAAVTEGGADSAFTAAAFHGFIWREDGSAQGVNHDHRSRPRRQDRPVEYLETGAAYAMRTAGFLEAGHRFFGIVRAVPTDPTRVLEIDEPGDLLRARALAPIIDQAEPSIPRAEVAAVVLDFDGTQTDDRAWITADGTEQVAVHRGDGMGIAALRDAGLPILILSSEVNDVVTARARKLQIDCIHGVVDKADSLVAWCREKGAELGEVVYVGNDLNDLSCLRLVGWPIAVGSAHSMAKDASRFTTLASGGDGAVREVAEWILGKDLNR